MARFKEVGKTASPSDIQWAMLAFERELDSETKAKWEHISAVRRQTVMSRYNKGSIWERYLKFLILVKTSLFEPMLKLWTNTAWVQLNSTWSRWICTWKLWWTWWTLFSKSNSSQVANRTSADRAAVRMPNSVALAEIEHTSWICDIRSRLP